jgi:hypothetical protein
MKIYFIMGPTNVGKSTFMDYAKAQPGCATVEVGRMLRAKYPPEFFAGQAAPKHTQAEAWQMMLDGIAAAEAQGAARVFVDGQPRDMQQAERCVRFDNSCFRLLWVPGTLREARAKNRDADDPAKLELSLHRLQTDLLTGYDVVMYVASVADFQVIDCTALPLEQVFSRVVA